MKTPLVDYCMPFSYWAVVLASQETEGTIMAPKCGTNDSALTQSWPKLTLGVTGLERYPYRQHMSPESTWLVVPK